MRCRPSGGIHGGMIIDKNCDKWSRQFASVDEVFSTACVALR